jgi:methylglutaconyl-CoA hydratase
LETHIIFEKKHDIVFLTLNRPEKRNALSPELIGSLQTAIENVKKMPDIRAVIFTGSGSTFCAGADLQYLKKISQFSDAENLEDSQRLMHLFLEIYHLPKLTIAMVNGPALAGGCGLALCCDFIFADEQHAGFGFTEVRIGFVPAIVMNFLIRRISLQDALHLTIGADILSAEEARSIGMVRKLFPAAQMKSRTLEFVEKYLTQNSFEAMMQTKKLYQDVLELPLNDGLDLAARINAGSRKSPDCQKGLKNFLDKKPTRWRNL